VLGLDHWPPRRAEPDTVGGAATAACAAEAVKTQPPTRPLL